MRLNRQSSMLDGNTSVCSLSSVGGCATEIQLPRVTDISEKTDCERATLCDLFVMLLAVGLSFRASVYAASVSDYSIIF